MSRSSRERWIFTVELPTGVTNGGRFMARLLKHLLRVWGVRATAILDAPSTEPESEPRGSNYENPPTSPMQEDVVRR